MDRNSISKLASLTISIYILVAVVCVEGAEGLLLAVVLVPILACIWFGEVIGGMTGFGGFRSPVVNKESPGCLVSGLAWIVLIVLAAAFTKRLL